MSFHFKAKRGMSFYGMGLILSVFLLVWSGCSSKDVPVSSETSSGGSGEMGGAPVALGGVEEEVYKYIDSQTTAAQYQKILPMIQQAAQADPQGRTPMDYLLLSIEKHQAGDAAGMAAMVQAGLDLKPEDRTLKGHLMYMRGLAQGEAGDYKKAKGSYQNAMLMIPDFEPAILQMGMIYLNVDKNEKQAKMYFDMGLRRNPNRVEYYYGLASLYEYQGDWAGAEEMYQSALGLKPGSPDVLRALGSIYLIQARFEDAVKMFSSPALSGDPEVQFQLGTIYAGPKPDAAKAAAAFNRAVELSPDNADYHLALARVVKSTDPEKAKGHLETALRLRPDAPTYIQAAGYYRSVKAYKESLELLDKAEKLDPKYSGIPLNKGLVRVEQKLIKEARAEFEKAAKLDPQDTQAAYYIQLLNFDPKDPNLEEPRQWAEKVLADPSDPEPHYALGMYYLKERKFDFAFLEADNLQLLDPNIPSGHWLMAEILLVQRKFPQVKTELDWLIDHHPRHVKTLQIADTYFENTIQIKEWEEFYRSQFSAKKDELQLQYGLIRVYYSTEDIDRMMKSYELVTTLETDKSKNADNYVILADLYVEKGDNKYAQLVIKRAITSDPGNKLLEAKLEELKKPIQAPDYMENVPGKFVRNLIIPSSRNWSKLHTAAAKGNVNKVKRLIGRGEVIDATNDEGLTPLHEAVKRNQMTVVQFLVESGANIHAADSQDQMQAIHLAVQFKRIQILEYLISKGANLEARNSVGDTPLVQVSQLEWQKDNKVAQLLIKKGANVEAANVFGCQALCYAAKLGNTKLVKTLLGKGADINHIGAKGHTPLVMAIMSEDDKLVEYLLEMGADPTHKFEGSSLVKFASKYNQPRMVTLLKRAH